MAVPTSEIRWFADRTSFRAFSEALAPNSRAVEQYVGGLPTYRGYCHRCCTIVGFQVSGGADFGHHPNLREGLICERCGLNNRQRLMFHAVMTELAGRHQPKVVLMERFSRFYSSLYEVVSSLIATEFLGPHVNPGDVVLERGAEVRHESATALSFADRSLDLLIHADVLEHIADYRAALSEACRALDLGGVLLFTCPFFENRDDILVRATVGLNGEIEHLQPPEVHGNPLSADGILAFYHFGWALLDELKATGFSDVRIGVLYDPMAGLTGNNYGHDHYGTMLPLFFRCEK